MKARDLCFDCLTATLLVVLLSASLAWAKTPVNTLFGEANEAYSRGNYDQAIEKYEQITQSTGYAPGVLYNLANSYALSGKVGKAVVNYERALRLAPSDSDITGNLELIKKEHGLFPPEPSKAERFFGLLRLNQWTTLMLLALVSFTGYLAASMKYRLSRQLTLSAAAGCLVLLGLGTAGTIHGAKYFNPSVVITPEVKMLISPFASSASIGTLPEGRLVYQQKTHANFSSVTDEMDRQGWVESAHLEPVCKPIQD